MKNALQIICFYILLQWHKMKNLHIWEVVTDKLDKLFKQQILYQNTDDLISQSNWLINFFF